MPAAAAASRTPAPPDAEQLERGGGAYRAVKSVAKACRILEAFTELGPEVGVNEMARHLRLSVSVAFRIMQTMRDHAFLEQDPHSGRFRIGARALEVGLQYAHRHTFAAAALDALQATLPEYTCWVGVLTGHEVLTLGAAEGNGPIKIGTHGVGVRQQAHTTAIGKALLALMSEDEVLGVLRRSGTAADTPASITSPRALIEDLRKTRERGYAISDEESIVGVMSIGVPVFDSFDQPAGAISVSSPKFTMQPGDIERIGKTLLGVARDLQGRLAEGRRPPRVLSLPAKAPRPRR